MDRKESNDPLWFYFKESALEIISVDENGVVMSAKIEKKIYGQFWHPEREVNDSPEDINVFKHMFGVENE